MPSTGRENFKAPLRSWGDAIWLDILAITYPLPPDGGQKPKIELTIKVGIPHTLSQPHYTLQRIAAALPETGSR